MFQRFKSFIRNLFRRQRRERIQRQRSAMIQEIRFNKRTIREIGEEIGGEIRRGLGRVRGVAGLGVQDKDEIKIKESYVSPLDDSGQSEYDYYFNKRGFREQQISSAELENSSKALNKVFKKDKK